MNDAFMVPAYVVIDTVLQQLAQRSHPAAQLTAAEVVTVAVVAAKYFQHHHARAVPLRQRLGSLSGRVSPSRFSRRRPALAAWVRFRPETLGALFATGAAVILDRLPLPVCRRARARRCRTVRGRAYCGSGAAKREQCFGWRRQLLCTAAGVPVACDVLPAGLHDRTPVQE
jgi:hypothetical protein